VRGRGDDDVGDAGRASGHGAHHDRGRIRAAPSRRVDGGARDRQLAQPDPLTLVELYVAVRDEPGSRHAAWTPEGGLMVAMFQIPNKFHSKDGRVIDQHGRNWDEIWGQIGLGRG